MFISPYHILNSHSTNLQLVFVSFWIINNYNDIMVLKTPMTRKLTKHLKICLLLFGWLTRRMPSQSQAYRVQNWYNQSVNLSQYSIKSEALPGITDTIKGLLQAGVIYPTISLWNTPILLVLKADGKNYRKAHDLRAINLLVLEPSQAVPNPTTALSQLTPKHQWFTVIAKEKKRTLSKELQPIFAFTFSGQQYTYTRMPQGFSLTPGIFNTILRQLLQKSPPLPDNILLIQYVDNLLIASHTRK